METAFVNQPALIRDVLFPLKPVEFALCGTGICVIAVFILYRSSIRSILRYMKQRFFQKIAAERAACHSAHIIHAPVRYIGDPQRFFSGKLFSAKISVIVP